MLHMFPAAKCKEQIFLQYKPINHRFAFYSVGDACMRDIRGQMLIAHSRVHPARSADLTGR